jgi:hypothetical protein
MEAFLGFKEEKARAIQKILEGKVYHVPREFDKNEYAQGLLSDEQVIAIIKSCKGDRYEMLPHHAIKSVAVHILKPAGKYDGYYVKFYFLEPDVCFISVHRSEYRQVANGNS